jgi:hypothetical protein
VGTVKNIDRFERERGELEAILSSGIFDRAPNLASFLQYICRKCFDGESAEIKEYSVAVEALGRPPSFDPKRDSIVRVEAHRLRKRLKQYYETAGAGHPVRINFAAGSYVPEFVDQSPPEAASPTVEVAAQPNAWRKRFSVAAIVLGAFSVAWTV